MERQRDKVSVSELLRADKAEKTFKRQVKADMMIQ